ncbi:MAG: SH3 domain-containing protein [Treponema sp.]|nr:SH3 domain-containing protein [Treponema sp.]
MGYGILLWSIEEPPVLSGAVLPVYIRSNIDQVWVVGVPVTGSKETLKKIEIPLTQFEFSGSKRKALKKAHDFLPYALSYAENLQDGLPIRDNPDNNARRVYRLRLGEIIKVLNKVNGNPPISASGEPLSGDWYKVLTEDGVTGFCFSYRLKMFEQGESSIQSSASIRRETQPDPDLDLILSKRWSPEYYQQMINSRQVVISELEKHYHFDPGHNSGVAKIILPNMKREFTFDGIYSEGERAWRFEGSDLQMDLRTNTTLAVQYMENTGLRNTIVFVALSSDVDDIIMHEVVRRERQFSSIYDMGPVFTSNHYGTITFAETGGFTWTGFNSLVPNLIPFETAGVGSADIDLFLSASFAERYSGAFTLRFTDITPNKSIPFMYILDNQGLMLEVVPDYGVENSVVTRQQAPNPITLYFFRDSAQF